MSKSYDISTSAKWANLAEGNHSVTIVAKGTGIADSLPSTAVTVLKPYTIYDITNALTNVTADGENPSTIGVNDSVTLIYTANSGYKLPTSVTVTGATYTWTQSTGVLDISNPTGNVMVTIVGVAIPTYTVTMNVAGMTYLPASIPNMKEGETQTIQFTANDGYILPEQSAITVTNATITSYVKITDTSATMIIGNPTGNVTVKADGIANEFNIVNHLTNVTADGENPTFITRNDSVTLQYYAASGYALPDSITVTGATYTYNKTTGIVDISNATSEVNITIVGVVAQEYQINGKWTLPDGEDAFSGGDNWFTETVNFTSNGMTFTGLTVHQESAQVESQAWYLQGSTQTVVFGKNFSGTWVNTNYCTIDFGITAQIVSETFYNWFIERATEVTSFTVTLTSWDEDTAHDNGTLIKVGSAPTSMTDCTYRTGFNYDDTGLYNASGTKVNSPVTITDVSTIYLWQGGGYSSETDTWSGSYILDGTRYDFDDGDPGSIWSNPVVITPTSDIALELLHARD